MKQLLFDSRQSQLIWYKFVNLNYDETLTLMLEKKHHNFCSENLNITVKNCSKDVFLL